VKSVSCKGVRVQVVLLQAARSCSVSAGSIKYIAKYNSFPFMCGRVGAWAAEHGSNPVQTCQVVQ